MRRQNLDNFLRQFDLYKQITDEAINNLQKRIEFLEDKLGCKYEPENKINKINSVELSMMGNNDEK